MRRLIACAFFAAGLLGVLPRAAMAHLGLSSSAPADGARVAAAPRSLRLEFTEGVKPTMARVQLLGPGGRVVRLSSLRQPADSLQVIVADVPDELAAGEYVIEWRVVGTDGHPVSGTIRFVVVGGAGTNDSARAPAHHDEATMPTGSGFDSESIGYVAVRWAGFLALVSLLGTVAFRSVVLPLARRRGEDPNVLLAMHARAIAIGRWAAIALVVATGLRLGAQILTLTNGAGGFDTALVRAMVLDSTWGWAWMLQLVLALAVLAGLQAMYKGRGRHWPVVAVGILLLAFTPALSGHAVAMPERTGLAVVMDALHVVGAGGWMGSLLLVLLAGLPVAILRRDGEGAASVRRLVEAFSPTALAFAALLGLTGIYAAWVHIGFSSALWESSYGRVLLLKLAILSLALAIGAYNWRVIRPRLGSDGASRALRPSVIAELSVGALVLLVTAVLVATPPPPMDGMPMPEPARDAVGAPR